MDKLTFRGPLFTPRTFTICPLAQFSPESTKNREIHYVILFLRLQTPRDRKGQMPQGQPTVAGALSFRVNTKLKLTIALSQLSW